ncbi:MAG: glycosyltransferase family 4 protein [Chloroflexaceae bacterium]|nr:glycosyltransferase family 4 protein [Chloroflexaceae bacterium]
MRILMLSWEYPPHIIGGMGAHVADITPALAAEGIEVMVVTPRLREGKPDEVPSARIRVVRVPIPTMDAASFIGFVAHANQELERAARDLYLQVGGFDLIHTHDWLTARTAIGLKQYWRIPLIATIHATERGRGRGALHGEQALHIDGVEWQLTYEAWRIIVCSHFMSRQLHETLRTPLDKIDVVPNGTHIRPSPFASTEARLAFRRKYASDDEYIVFYVGRIVYEKGLHVLLDAWPRVLRQVGARLVIAGSGPYLDTLKAQARALGLEKRVIFTGFISDEERDSLYYVADVTTFPSLYEPFGIVVLEAFAAGSPVVVSQTGGLMEVVRKDETGLFVRPGDPESLAQGILSTVQCPDRSSMRVANAWQEVHDLYNWQHIARETITIYQRVYTEWQASGWGKRPSLPPEGPSFLPSGPGTDAGEG